MKKIFNIIFIVAGMFLFSSCNEENLEPESIFNNEDELPDPDSYSYLLDCWLYENYLLPFNLQFRYRMRDVETDMDYNLVPADYDKAIDMAVLTKYLWFDAYTEIAGINFLKLYGPRMIHLIGSAAHNPANGTMMVGLAESGVKITLFRCNQLDAENVDGLNDMYFHTMHHEFIHILHQVKSYQTEFNAISANYYEPYSWEDRDFEPAASLGFVSSYAGAEAREDFVEVISNYIVKTDEQWEHILDVATKGWVVSRDILGNELIDEDGHRIYKEVEDSDGVDGKAVILEKLFLCKQWMKDSWGIDLEELRHEVLLRQENLDINLLRKQLER